MPDNPSPAWLSTEEREALTKGYGHHSRGAEHVARKLVRHAAEADLRLKEQEAEIARGKRVVREMIRHNGELHGKISALEVEVTRLREALENFMAYGKDLIRREGPTGVEGGFFESLEIAREALAATPAKPAEPSHTILPVCLICRRNQKEHEQGNGCGRPVYGTVAATFYLRDDRVVIEGPAEPIQHGVNCPKVEHSVSAPGFTKFDYQHAPDYDGPFQMDGKARCGRCHVALPAEGTAR